MSISYPLALPALRFVSIRILERDEVGMGESPFTLLQQTQEHAGQRWEVDVQYPPMLDPAIVESILVFLTALKGRTGTFLMGVDPLRSQPRGTWAGSPQVAGAHAARSPTLALDGFTAGATIKAGDYVQVGSGSASRVHKLLTDQTANGSGQLTCDIWPNLRTALSDNAPIVFNAPKCLWRLASNERGWSIDTGFIYGVAFSAVEAL